ncbi:MAG: hypothetical protein V4604_01865 [Bacteroidota bacterium]
METTDNNQPLEQLENLLSTYDERGLRLIQDYLKSHTSQTQENKANEHLDVREMLDEVHQLQHHAARVGQVHIVDHHQRKSRVFIATATSFQIWTNGKLHGSPGFPRTSIKAIQTMEFFSYTRADGKVWENAIVVADENRILSFNLQHPTEHTDTNTPIAVNSILHLFPHEYYLYEKDLGIVNVTFEDVRTNHGPSTFIRRSHSTVDIPGGIGTYQSFRARMAFDYSAKDLYIADPGNGIRRVDVGQKKPFVTNLYSSMQVTRPINVAFDQELRLLLILDAATRKIYGSLVDQEQSYPSFNRFEQALQLPEAVLTNGTSFTYSCWLKRGPNRSKDWKKHLPDTLFGFYINEGEHEITLHYHADGEAQSVSFAAPIPPSDWFHFSWIKRGNRFEVLIDEWSYQLPAPERINLNRELMQMNLPVLFCVPGYMAAEIAIWDHDLSVQEIKNNCTVWLTSTPQGLTGYWHLQVSNRETEWTNEEHSFLDASGHGHDLNGQQLMWQLASSPLDALLPLYSIPGKKMSQGFTVDTSLHQLYWCEVLDNGHTRLMRGSTFGHTEPVVLEILKDSVIDLRVDSTSNDAFEELILAHARRRKVIQEAIERATQALEQHASDLVDGHGEVHNAHADIQESLAQALFNRKELTQMLQNYKNVLDETHRLEKQKERDVAQARLDAIEKARQMVSSAHLEAAAFRRKGGRDLIDGTQ